MTQWIESDMNLWWNIKNVWHKLTYPFTRVWDWAVKSIQYSVFLWGEWDWDFLYILRMLQYKLKRTRKQILENNIILRAEEVAAQIKHAEDLIQKYIDNRFCEKMEEAHEKKWGKVTRTTKEVERNGKKIHQFDIQRANVTTEKEKAQERLEQKTIWNQQDYERQECWDEIFEYLKKYGQEFWD